MHSSFNVSKSALCPKKTFKIPKNAFFDSIQFSNKKIKETFTSSILVIPTRCKSITLRSLSNFSCFLLWTQSNWIELIWLDLNLFNSFSIVFPDQRLHRNIGKLFLSRWSWLKMPKNRKSKKIEKSKKVVLPNPSDLPHFALLTPLKWFYISEIFRSKMVINFLVTCFIGFYFGVTPDSKEILLRKSFDVNSKIFLGVYSWCFNNFVAFLWLSNNWFSSHCLELLNATPTSIHPSDFWRMFNLQKSKNRRQTKKYWVLSFR